MKYIIPLLFMSTFAHAAPPITLGVSTEINMNELYSNSIMSVYFDPDNFNLLVNSNMDGFEGVETTLFIKTNIPKDVESISFNITLIENQSSCTGWAENEVDQPGFVTVAIDNTTMALDVPVLLEDFNANDGTYKTSQHPFTLDFKRFELIDIPVVARTCQGRMVVNIGVDI